MTGSLDDLRYLRMAAILETAFERFALDVALNMIQDRDVRNELLKVVPRDDRHYDRLIQAADRVMRENGPDRHLDLVRAAVMTVRDAERTARDFYLRVAKELTDPDLRRLFEEIGQEEEAHVRQVDKVLDLLRPDSDALRQDLRPFLSDLQWVHDLETLAPRKGAA